MRWEKKQARRDSEKTEALEFVIPEGSAHGTPAREEAALSVYLAPALFLGLDARPFKSLELSLKILPCV